MDYQTQKNLLDIVKRNYEEIADDFNETRKRHAEPLWSELVKITKRIKKNNKILDVGCGNGRLLKIIGDKDINYLGIDSSEKLIKIAKSEIRHPSASPSEAGRAKSEFRTGNILELSQIPELNFDYVFFVAVLHHIPGKKLRIQALKHLRNKVTQDGKIIITAWNLWSQKKFRKLIIKFFFLKLLKKNKMDLGDILFSGFNAKSQRYYHAFTKRGLRKIAKKAGLKIDRIYKDKFNYYAILRKKS